MSYTIFEDCYMIWMLVYFFKISGNLTKDELL